LKLYLLGSLKKHGVWTFGVGVEKPVEVLQASGLTILPTVEIID